LTTKKLDKFLRSFSLLGNVPEDGGSWGFVPHETRHGVLGYRLRLSGRIGGIYDSRRIELMKKVLATLALMLAFAAFGVQADARDMNRDTLGQAWASAKADAAKADKAFKDLFKADTKAAKVAKKDKAKKAKKEKKDK
jgi:hypothetical protein